MQKCGTVSGFSVQGCLEFVACSYVDLHVQEGNLLGGVFESEFDRGVEVFHENLHGLELFGGAQEDQEDVIYESLTEGDCPDKGFLDGFFMTTRRKFLSMSGRLLYFRMVSSNTSILRGLGVLWGRVLACSFIWCNTDSMPFSCVLLV